MSSAREHYADLLGEVYEWSVSQRSDPFERAAAWLIARGLTDADRYLDLGAGFGAHVLPLLRRGKDVTAVDADERLLSRLVDRGRDVEARGGRLEVQRGDLLGFLSRARDLRWDVALCLGDTLTHLETKRQARDCVLGAADVLEPGGRLVLSYRDSTGLDLRGVARFLPVAQDGKRDMHCMLEVVDDDHLRVTDIVAEVGRAGPRIRISDYLKLRLAPAEIEGWAREAGLRLEHRSVESGMTDLIFRRPEGIAERPPG